MKEITVRPFQPTDNLVCDKLVSYSWMKTYPNSELGITLGKIISVDFIQEALTIPTNKKNILQFASNETRGKFVAIQDEEIVGYLKLERKLSQISSLYVHPLHEGRGVGTLLMVTALEELKKRSYITLDVVKYTFAAQFYEKFGFEVYREDTNTELITYHNSTETLVFPILIMIKDNLS
jgi:GNAT superfamily N-acetyltransferase